MIIGLDSSFAPSVAQAEAARAAGIGVWSGYLATKPNVGLYHPWSLLDFQAAKVCGGIPIAFASGWDDPVACKTLAAAWGVRLCLDVEGGIRPDGAWVQGWLDMASAGLYGLAATHNGRRATFHIMAWYPGHDPQATWPANVSRPAAPCGWQWQNTHTEFGIGVDRSWLDPWFGGEADDMTPEEHGILMAMSANVARLYYVLGLDPAPPSPASKSSRLDAIEAQLAALKSAPSAAPAGTISGTITGTITPK